MITYNDLNLEFISESGDACSHYHASLKGEHTLQELIDYAISNKRNWGRIYVFDGDNEIDSIEYRYGEVLNEPNDKTLLNKIITLKRLDGGWTCDDFTCCIN